MLSLVYENASNFTLPINAPTGTIAATMVLRPRLEGYETALRGAALSAKFADEALVSFQIRPTLTGSLATMQAYLSVQPYQVLGVDVDDSGASSYPVPERDVSGLLTLFQGKLNFNVSLAGVSKVSLRIVNLGAAAQDALIYTQIYGRIRPEEWECERLGYKEA
jgi:hypothetical protein